MSFSDLLDETLSLFNSKVSLLIYPLLSLLVIYMGASLFLGVNYLDWIKNPSIFEKYIHDASITKHWVQWTLFYVSTGVVLMFLRAVMICAVSDYHQGKAHHMIDSVATIFRHGLTILLWGIIASTIGLFFNFLQKRFKSVEFLLEIIEAVWGVYTYLMLPVIIFENKSLSDAWTRSKSLGIKSWIEQCMGSLGVGMVLICLFIPILVLIMMGLFISPESSSLYFGFAVISVIFLVIGAQTFFAIFDVSLYYRLRNEKII